MWLLEQPVPDSFSGSLFGFSKEVLTVETGDLVTGLVSCVLGTTVRIEIIIQNELSVHICLFNVKLTSTLRIRSDRRTLICTLCITVYVILAAVYLMGVYRINFLLVCGRIDLVGYI